MTPEQEAQLCTDIGRIATALEAILAGVQAITTAAQKTVQQQEDLRPARPARQATAPQRRVTA